MEDGLLRTFCCIQAQAFPSSSLVITTPASFVCPSSVPSCCSQPCRLVHKTVVVFPSPPQEGLRGGRSYSEVHVPASELFFRTTMEPEVCCHKLVQTNKTCFPSLQWFEVEELRVNKRESTRQLSRRTEKIRKK